MCGEPEKFHDLETFHLEHQCVLEKEEETRAAEQRSVDAWVQDLKDCDCTKRDCPLGKLAAVVHVVENGKTSHAAVVGRASNREPTDHGSSRGSPLSSEHGDSARSESPNVALLAITDTSDSLFSGVVSTLSASTLHVAESVCVISGEIVTVSSPMTTTLSSLAVSVVMGPLIIPPTSSVTKTGTDVYTLAYFLGLSGQIEEECDGTCHKYGILS